MGKPQYRWISHDFAELRKLKFAYVMKGVVAFILILLAIAFAVALYQATDVGGQYSSLQIPRSFQKLVKADTSLKKFTKLQQSSNG